MKTKNKKYFHAFTLVELIIVITILSVLATIAFVSFSGYTKNSRDANRISTLGNVKKGLSIYFTQTGNYPTPESIYLTGNLNGTLLTQVGYLKDNISRLLNISKIPVDPQSGNNYVYATSPNNKHYQLGSTLEGTQNITQLIQLTYADNYKAYVIGEYRGLLNYNGYIYNLPSLIITGTGNLSITSYVINKGNNLPYGLNGQTLNNTQTVGEVFTQLTGTSSTLTGIVLPTNKDAYMSNSGTYKSALGYDIDTLGQEIFGTQYFAGGNVSAVTSGGSSNSSSGGGISGWRSLDPNCDIDDIVIGTQTWAGCNSTLGNGVEWGKQSNGADGTIGSCYSYTGASLSIANCPIATTGNSMISNAKEKSWNIASEVAGTQDNIWGKLYTWTNSPTACPTGRHVPSEIEFATAENYLYGSVCRNGIGWECEGLGWLDNDTKNASNNLVQALKIPLSGRFETNGSFNYRGVDASLWLSTYQNVSNSYRRYFSISNSNVNNGSDNNALGYAVRCIKD